MATSAGEITALLAAVRRGDLAAENRLAGIVYAEMRAMASRYMRRERSDHTLQPTALVHEAYLRLIRKDGADLSDRAHFFATAAIVMRRILIDHARQRAATRNGGELYRVDLQDLLTSSYPRYEELLALDQALTRLSEFAPRQGQVVEMMYFGGLTEKEVAIVLGVAERTVRRDWRLARAWLQAEIRGNPR